MPAGGDIFTQMEVAFKARLKEEYHRGVKAAAEIADGYNSSTIHEYKLGDCILAKLNILKGDPKKNKQHIVQHGDGKKFIPKGKKTLCADGTVY